MDDPRAGQCAVADLLDRPAAWRSAYDLVVDSITVQALPAPPRGDAIRDVSSPVAPGGTLVVIAFGSDSTTAERAAWPGPPGRWSGTRSTPSPSTAWRRCRSSRCTPTRTCGGGRPSAGPGEGAPLSGRDRNVTNPWDVGR